MHLTMNISHSIIVINFIKIIQITLNEKYQHIRCYADIILVIYSEMIFESNMIYKLIVEERRLVSLINDKESLISTGKKDTRKEI